MNALDFEEPVRSSGNAQPSDPVENSPVLNSDLSAEKYPVGPDIPQVMPMPGNEAAIAPLDDPIVHETPIVDPVTYSAPSSTIVDAPVPLLKREESEHLRTRWNEIQGQFVDEPRAAVQKADALVSEVVEKITQMFASEHSSLEGQWKQGMDVSTEDLRKALQHYRSFFNRLVV